MHILDFSNFKLASRVHSMKDAFHVPVSKLETIPPTDFDSEPLQKWQKGNSEKALPPS